MLHVSAKVMRVLRGGESGNEAKSNTFQIIIELNLTLKVECTDRNGFPHSLVQSPVV